MIQFHSGEGIKLLLASKGNALSQRVLPYLDSLGYTISQAATAAETWSLMTSHIFDVLLLDSVLPGMEGI
ncbi:MAG: hypothetical protein ACI4P0_02220, partial [Mailhella sp.]